MNYNTLTATQDGFRDEKVDFTPSKSNNALAAITSQYYSIYANSPQGHYDELKPNSTRKCIDKWRFSSQCI